MRMLQFMGVSATGIIKSAGCRSRLLRGKACA